MNVLEAFAFTIGWKVDDYDKGVKDVTAKQKGLREDAHKTAKELELANKRTADSFSRVRDEVVGMFLAFKGAGGLKDFISNILTGEAATGRMAANFGTTTRELAAWEHIITRVGGKSSSADSAVGRMTAALQSYMLTGTTGIDPDLLGLGLSPGDLRSPTEALLKIADAGEKMSKPEFAARLSRIGFDQDTINLLERGRKGLEAWLEDARKLDPVTQANAEATQKLQENLARLGDVITGNLRPDINWFADVLTKVSANEDAVNVVTDTTIGLMGALAIATLAAVGPWLALAAAIGAAAYAYQHWDEIEPKVHKAPGYDDAQKNAPWYKKAYNWLFWGKDHPGKLINPDQKSDALSLLSTPTGTASAVPEGRTTGERTRKFLEANGFTDKQALGIWAGIRAESRGDPNAVNPTSGAYGLGQWLGPRKKALFARYGPNPTLEQQLEFLLWELKGGDSGGAAVRAQTSVTGTADAYIRRFMRPGAGTAGDLQRVQRYLSGSGRTVVNTTNIGSITVNTKATDAAGVAAALPGAIKNRSLVTQADSGLSG